MAEYRHILMRIARDNHDGDYHSRVTEIEVPTNKAGLIEFLNKTVMI